MAHHALMNENRCAFINGTHSRGWFSFHLQRIDGRLIDSDLRIRTCKRAIMSENNREHTTNNKSRILPCRSRRASTAADDWRPASRCRPRARRRLSANRTNTTHKIEYCRNKRMEFSDNEINAGASDRLSVPASCVCSRSNVASSSCRCASIATATEENPNNERTSQRNATERRRCDDPTSINTGRRAAMYERVDVGVAQPAQSRHLYQLFPSKKNSRLFKQITQCT
jgi:hypothetical protein